MLPPYGSGNTTQRQHHAVARPEQFEPPAPVEKAFPPMKERQIVNGCLLFAVRSASGASQPMIRCPQRISSPKAKKNSPASPGTNTLRSRKGHRRCPPATRYTGNIRNGSSATSRKQPAPNISKTPPSALPHGACAIVANQQTARPTAANKIRNTSNTNHITRQPKEFKIKSEIAIAKMTRFIKLDINIKNKC